MSFETAPGEHTRTKGSASIILAWDRPRPADEAPGSGRTSRSAPRIPLRRPSGSRAGPRSSPVEINRKMGIRPIFGHKRGMRALCRAWLHGSLVVAGVVSNGCTDAPTVEVAVRVDDLEAQTQHGAIPSWEALRSHLSALEDAAQIPAAPQSSGPGLITETPKSPAALRRALAALDRAPQEELPGIVFHLRELDSALWPVVDAELRRCPVPRATTRRSSTSLEATSPTATDTSARAWKRRHGYAVKLSDWVGDLLALPSTS